MLDKIWLEQEPCIIAEISQNHDGSLGQAHAFIDAVADMGVDAVKFQTHIASEESTLQEPFRVKFSYEDKTRYDYWKRMEFTFEQWVGLFEHAHARGIDFISSPFSMQAFDMLQKIGIPAWKFGAGEVFNKRLLKAAIDTGKPIMLSTGLSTWADIDEQVKRILANGNKFLLFQCVTAYPSTADMININLISQMREKYHCPVGVSDHSATIYPSLAAMALGAKAVEVHVTLSPYMFGPDVKASVSLEDLKRIVEGAKFISKMKNCKFDLEHRDVERENLKKMFSKSLYYRHNYAKGHIVEEEDLIEKKPNIGIGAEDAKYVIGKILKKDVNLDDIVCMEDVISE